MLQINPEAKASPTERTHTITESPVLMADGSTQNASLLAKRFYSSSYGLEMRSQPLRYSVNFGYEPNAMVSDIGYDVCPVGHQVELAFHLGRIIDEEQSAQTFYGALDEHDLGTLALACLVHDIGESTHADLLKLGYTTVGDIPAGCKTQTDREHEAAIRQFFYSELFSDVSPEIIERVENIINHKDDSHLQDLFEAAHILQTFETSNNAHQKLAELVWYKNGEPFDISNAVDSRASGLLGIARVSALQSFKELESYRYFAAIDAMLTASKKLRYPQHQLF